MGYPLLVLILPHASSNWEPRLQNKMCKYLRPKIWTFSSFAASRGWLTAESIGLSGRFIQFNYYYLFYIHESGCPMLQLQSLYGQQQLCWQLCWAHAKMRQCSRIWLSLLAGTGAADTAALPISSISINEQGSEGCCNSYRTLLKLSINDLVL